MDSLVKAAERLKTPVILIHHKVAAQNKATQNQATPARVQLMPLKVHKTRAVVPQRTTADKGSKGAPVKDRAAAALKFTALPYKFQNLPNMT